MLPYSKQTITEGDICAVVEVLKSDYLTTGPTVSCFEAAFAEKVGVSHAVAVSSGTAALHTALFALGVEAGDEVVVPAMTFVATANAVKMCGAEVVFADVDPDTLLIDVGDVKRKVDEKTAAIIGVDFAGQPCDLKELRRVVANWDAWVIEDACHSLGATYHGCEVGGIFAHAACFSFHPVKAITTGEGGMVTTNDQLIVKKARRFRDHGRHNGECEELGHNYRLSDIACALGLSQLKRLDEFISRRQQIAKRYDQAFEPSPIRPLKQLPARESARHLYVVRIPNRDRFRAKLAENGIGTQVHYKPVTLQPYYSDHKGSCPVAEREWEHIVSLPCYPLLTDEEQDTVIEAAISAAG